MTGETHIDYEALVQRAMRTIVRAVLARVVKSGLPGDHHFYIAFNTEAPGVVISKRLREKYPEEMTVVLQHRFWDLSVQDDRFEVKLTFDSIPERLVVPYTAIKVFFDPSVPYGLQFEDTGFSDDIPHAFSGVENGADSPGQRPGPALAAESHAPPGLGIAGAARLDKKPRAGRKPKVEKSPEPAAEGATSKPFPKPDEPVVAANDTKIIRLDKFRKK